MAQLLLHTPIYLNLNKEFYAYGSDSKEVAHINVFLKWLMTSSVYGPIYDTVIIHFYLTRHDFIELPQVEIQENGPAKTTHLKLT